MKKQKSKLPQTPDQWFVYILICAGGRLYTGMTNDVARRFRQHIAGAGGHFTRAFKPTELVYAALCGTRSDALKREAWIKRLPRKQKLLLAKGFTSRLKKTIMKNDSNLKQKVKIW